MVTNNELVNLESFEVFAYDGAHIKAINMLVKLLNQKSAIASSKSFDEPIDDYQHRTQLIVDRFASAITSLFVNNNWPLTPIVFSTIMQVKNKIIKLFLASSFKGTDHLLPIMSQIKYDTVDDQYRRFQLVISLNSKRKFIELVMSGQNLDITTLVWMVSDLSFSKVENEDLREQLIESLLLRSETTKIPDILLKYISTPWMYCSYLVSAKRHKIKLALNNMVLNRFKIKTKIDSKKLNNSKKSVILVCLEKFLTGNAMFRCHSHMLKSLKSHFYVIFVSKKLAIDENVISFCDEFYEVPVEIDEKYNYQKLVKSLLSKKADIVLYPSLGMDSWTSVLCNFRLARTQCMTVGHPATSCSKEMDFVLNGTFNDPECFTEKIVVPKRVGTIYQKPNFILKAKHVQEKDIHVAVVSSSMKINVFFLATCQKIVESSKKSVILHFYAMVDGLNFTIFEKMVKEYLPNAIVHENAHYEQFINEVNQCQVRLGTFPFGGTNSNIDCFALGIPYVILDGPEAFSHIDAAMLKRVKFDNGLVAADIDDYIKKSNRLIEDDGFRRKKSLEMKKIYDSNIFFENQFLEPSGVSVDTLKWVLKNSKDIKMSDKKVFTEGMVF